ncbi:hypothetical protein AWZ03_010568 [Drosophila navojoa]|uniref:Uncharacterized protein n=1 Tax=Drosophila navojoa TaxID=7232 RepID=A0A484B2K3_DRONA|nr:hypothetical protein AWZ03_010568 [Drosophila navojoa]
MNVPNMSFSNMLLAGYNFNNNNSDRWQHERRTVNFRAGNMSFSNMLLVGYSYDSKREVKIPVRSTSIAYMSFSSMLDAYNCDRKKSAVQMSAGKMSFGNIAHQNVANIRFVNMSVVYMSFGNTQAGYKLN